MGLLRAPDGSIVTVPDEQAGQLIAGGYMPVTEGEAGATTGAMARPDSGALGGLGALASSSLSGATLGLSDLALKGFLDRGDFERMAADRENHPIASGVGQLAGAIVPSLAAPGSFAGSMPAGLLSQAGRGATEAAGALGGGVGTLAKLGVSGLEGSVYNAGAYLSDTALGDRDLSAEGLAGALGSGFEFGAGGGAAAMGIERGTIAARRMFSRLSDTGGRATAQAEQEWLAKYQATIEANDAAADIARAKLAEAQLARQQAGLARDQASAAIAETKAAAPELDAARARTAFEHEQAIAAERLAQPAPAAAPSPGMQGLQSMLAGTGRTDSQIISEAAEREIAEALQAHDAARNELETMLRRIEAPGVQSDAAAQLGQGIPAPGVPVGEFGAPGARGYDPGNVREPGPPSQAALANAPDGTPVKRALRKSTAPGEPTAAFDFKDSGLTFDPETRQYTIAEPGGAPGATKEPTQFSPTERPAGGSQGGKWYQDEHGQQWFGKSYGGNTDRIEGEHLANRIYREFGISAPDTRLADVGGKRMLMSREVSGKVATSAEDIAGTNAKDGFIIDAWLANHDVVGTGYDNILVSGGKATRIDNGGATIWRAHGEAKNFKAIVNELESLRDPQFHAGRAFSGLTGDEVKQQVARFATEYPAKKAAIDQAIDESALSRKAKEQIKTGLHDRATWLIEQANGPAKPLTNEEFARLGETARSALTDAQRDAALAYSRNGLYAQINAPLREMQGKAGGGGMNPVDKNLHKYVKNIDDAIASSPAPRRMLLMRGVNQEAGVRALEKLQPGDVYVDPGFVSTSYDPSIGADYSIGFGVRKGIELKITVPEGHPALAIPSEFPKEREIVLGRGGRYIVTAREVAEDGHTVLHMAVRPPDVFEAPKLPEGFALNAKDTSGKPIFDESPDIAFGIPQYKDIPNFAHSRKVAYVVKPSELAEVGITGSAKTTVDKWNGGLDLPAIEVDVIKGEAVNMGGDVGYVYQTAGYHVSDGSKRLLAAAADGDRPVLVRFAGKYSEPTSPVSLADDIRGAIGKAKPAAEATERAAAPATDTLTGLLRGTRDSLAAGKSLNDIGAPARAEYAAAKAAKSKASAEHFRAEAAAKRGETFEVRHKFLGDQKLSINATAKDVAGSKRTIVEVTRKLDNGETVPVGTAEFSHRDGKLYPEHVVVDQAWQRNGIGTRMYQAAESKTGLKVTAAKDQTPEGAAFSAKYRARGSAPDEGGDLLAALQGTKQGLDSGKGLRQLGGAAMVSDQVAAHPLAVKQLEIAHEAAVERAAAATEPAERAAAEREAAVIEDHLSRVSARPGAIEDIAAVADAATKYEKSGARLAEALGPEAPPASQEAAKAFRDAESAAERKTMDRTTRAIDDHVEQPAPAPRPGPFERFKAQFPEAGLPKGSAAKLADAKAEKLTADAVFSRARANETEARMGAQSAKRSADEARAAAEAAKPAVAAPAGKRLGALGTIATAVGVAGELGVPGIPKPHDIPVIGPLLSIYLKYRAIKAAAGRFVGRIPATADARAAALVAQTKDRIAVAVDRTLGLASKPAARTAIVAASVTLGRRVFDDGEPDAPKGASAQALAAVRIREIAAAASRPDLVQQQVRKQLRGIADPDLIAAAEQHMLARFQYLASVMPKMPPPNPFSKTEWQPSPAAADELAQRLAVAHDPEAVFKVTTPATVDTANNIYPKVIELAKARLMERISDVKHPMSYAEQLRGTLLFGMPLTDSMAPDSVAILQGAHAAMRPAPAPQPTSPPTPSIAAPANVNQLYDPGNQRRAGRM
jgi:ADP-ribosyltransferase exoenzyme/acetyltransferase (GNAT) family protein